MTMRSVRSGADKHESIGPVGESVDTENMSGFTCISCRVAFLDADLQRSHYKTDWHRYNLKRKVADLPPVDAESFQEKVLAHKTQAAESSKDTSGHCSLCNKHFRTKNAYENHIQSKKHQEAARKGARSATAEEVPTEMEKGTAEQTVAEKNLKNERHTSSGGSGSKAKKTRPTVTTAEEGESSGAVLVEQPGASTVEVKDEAMDSDAESEESWDGDALGLEECLFCSKCSTSIHNSIHHMSIKHGFFIPDIEFVSDLAGLIMYLGEKVGQGHMCLWCNQRSKMFMTTAAAQHHMVDKGHCKMLHDGDSLVEYSGYYDYRSSYPDYQADGAAAMETEEEDEEVELEELAENNYELVLPSGAVLGHRSLQRYFRQKLRPDTMLVVSQAGAVSKVMAQYKGLGWTGTTGAMAERKAKDMEFFNRIKTRKRLAMEKKANKLQKHFRDQNFGIRF